MDSGMTTDKTPIEQIFEDLGGTSAVAKLIGVGQSTASEMKRRKSIPVEYWPAIVSADKAEMTGITYDRMVAAHVHERGKGEVAA